MHEGAVEEGIAVAEHGQRPSGLHLGGETLGGLFVEGGDRPVIRRIADIGLGRHREGQLDLAGGIGHDDGVGRGAGIAAPAALAEMHQPVGREDDLAGPHSHQVRGARSEADAVEQGLACPAHRIIPCPAPAH
ncbi:hypothetical protein D3C87_1552260 [compost metagenome]